MEKETYLLLTLRSTISQRPRYVSPNVRIQQFIYQIFGILPEQWVLYLGNDKLNMPHQLKKKGKLHFSYHLLDIRTIAPDSFLATNLPELAPFAILAADGNTTQVLDKVLHIFDTHLEKGTLKWMQFHQRLRILAKLRNFEQIIEQTFSQMPISVELLETDTYYRKGLEKGRIEGLEKGAYQKAVETAIRMLQLNLSIDIITAATGLPETEVIQLANNIKKDNT